MTRTTTRKPKAYQAIKPPKPRVASAADIEAALQPFQPQQIIQVKKPRFAIRLPWEAFGAGASLSGIALLSLVIVREIYDITPFLWDSAAKIPYDVLERMDRWF